MNHNHLRRRGHRLSSLAAEPWAEQKVNLRDLQGSATLQSLSVSVGASASAPLNFTNERKKS